MIFLLRNVFSILVFNINKQASIFSIYLALTHKRQQTRCMSCHGDGWYTDSSGYKDRCFYCQSVTHGHGRQDCLKCNAKGRVACPPCDSYGQIRCFIRLTISWWDAHLVTCLFYLLNWQTSLQFSGSFYLVLWWFLNSITNFNSPFTFKL